MHVLVAEDVEDSRLMLDLALRQRGHQTTLAHEGAAAVRLIESAPTPPFDVIVMDIAMPVMGGLTAINHIRALPAGQTVPIVLITGNDYTDLQAWQAGADLMLRKPIDAAVFVARMEEIVRRCR